MPPSKVSCALCGGPITGDDEPSPLWMQQFRALYSRGRLSTKAYLSGVGRRELLRDAIRPGPIPDGQPWPEDGLLSIWVMRSSFGEPDPHLGEEDSWGFPFHESCWKLVVLVRPDNCVDVQVLFDVLQSFPIQDGLINFGHDYGGDAYYRQLVGTLHVGKERRLVRGPTPRHQTFDPLELPEICTFLEEERGSNGEPSCGAEVHPGHPITGSDPFSKLPPEVLQNVFEHLPTRCVPRLKQSSRVCANMSLSQSFWMTRFLPGREFQAIFEARQRPARLRGRWQSFYRLAKSVRHSEPFTNRERVYNLACSMRAIVDQVALISLSGDLVTPRALRWVDAHPPLKHRDATFSEESRDLWYRSLPVPAGGVRVFVSHVETYGRRYVSGVRFEAAGGSCLVLGYRHAASEVPVAVDGGISGFHLAQDERGFRALSVLSASGALSKWAGDHTGVPIRTLVFDPITAARCTVEHLKCGFDAFKIVSLSISDGSAAGTAFDGEQPLASTSRWFPSVPGPDLSVLGIDGRGLRYHDPQLPITMAMFDAGSRDPGGISGVAARIGDEGEVFDLEVCYPPGVTTLRLGLEDVIQGGISRFDIDGAGGERVRGVECFYEHHGSLLGVKLHTNKGRVGELSMEPLDGIPKEHAHAESLFPKNGMAVVGFCSRVSRRQGLIDLGLVCRAGPTEEEIL